MNRRLHHVGVVVASVEALGDTLGPTVLCFDDLKQKVRVRFVGDPERGLIELIEPAGNKSIANFLAKGGGLHHSAIEVDDFEAACAEVHAARGFALPVPDTRETTWIGFEKRWLAFFMMPNRQLLEVVGPLPSS